MFTLYQQTTVVSKNPAPYPVARAHPTYPHHTLDKTAKIGPKKPST